jgi:hypothetical protein
MPQLRGNEPILGLNNPEHIALVQTASKFPHISTLYLYHCA